MIKSVRIARMNILAENKFSKYMAYAIGEIVVVVIRNFFSKKTRWFTMLCPVRDVISVEQKQPINQRAFRYAIKLVQNNEIC
ncbi:hypothetical protein LX77_03456 [Gelidibacter algens]|uniref:Uncharacterized protein n=1 Tax=Gelidibacter algens TaxID=49280 RepID=A0A1A7QZD3_9FLAO|nr:hypothetical protein A9996_14625 [Gelidibacter algens]RAJ19713.1 hypothetical protein LX77_03456 [Gelidibacter algens]